MNEQNIKPEKITKPIQLLAVWLIGLILIESSLLTASGTITTPDWLPVFYAFSAVGIIPLFLALIFLLQTKYRTQIQEDVYYSKYLDKNTMQFIDVSSKPNITVDLIRQEINKIVKETQNSFVDIKTTLDKGEGKEKLDNLITISDSKIAELERIVKFSSINLHINRTIKVFPQIIETIRKIGFTTFEEFGNKEIPQNYLISFSKTVSPMILRDLILDLIPLGATYIGLIDDEEAITTNYGNAIFVGSYLYDSNTKVTIDQSVLNRIASLNVNSKITDLINK